MKTVFIAVPVKAGREEVAKAEMAVLARKAQEYWQEQVAVVECAVDFLEDRTALDKDLWILGKSIVCMSRAETVIFPDNWEHYRQLTLMHAAAEEYAFPILEEWEMKGGG